MHSLCISLVKNKLKRHSHRRELMQLNYSQVFAQIFNSVYGKKAFNRKKWNFPSKHRCSMLKNVFQFNACIFALNLSDEDKVLLVIQSVCTRFATFHHLKATLEFHFANKK